MFQIILINSIVSFSASTVNYKIVEGNTYDAFKIANLTGMIRVNGKLDYENITSYTLTVQASDGVHEDYAQVIINIDNVNDNPPVFTKNITRTIVEETLIEGCIANVSDFIYTDMFHVYFHYVAFFFQAAHCVLYNIISHNSFPPDLRKVSGIYNRSPRMLSDSQSLFMFFLKSPCLFID